MAELVCDTSALVALHQIGHLHCLQALSSGIIVPGAVETELATGRALGHDVPDVGILNWVTIRSAVARPSLPSGSQLGPGESEVLWLTSESSDYVAVLDDEPARRTAMQIGVAFTGTLGLLVDAKRAGLIAAVSPLLDDLDRCRFHMSPAVRRLILHAAGEAP